MDQKEKARWARIKRVYGIGPEEYSQLDKGHCSVCLREWSDKVRPAIDHDHYSGRVRGILCLFCNRYRVGRFRDFEMVQRIANYLREALDLPDWVVPPKKKVKRKRKPRKRK